MNRLRLALRILVHGVPRQADVAPAPSLPNAPVSDPPFQPAVPSAPAPPSDTATAPPRAPSEASSETIAALITLRDQVQTAAEDATDGQAAAFVTVARRLADILALEHTVPFEDVGLFDGARQRVVDTLDTDDPAKDYEIAASVRPGYVHGRAIERRQDVIVYRTAGGTGGGA